MLSCPDWCFPSHWQLSLNITDPKANIFVQNIFVLLHNYTRIYPWMSQHTHTNNLIKKCFLPINVTCIFHFSSSITYNTTTFPFRINRHHRFFFQNCSALLDQLHEIILTAKESASTSNINDIMEDSIHSTSRNFCQIIWHHGKSPLIYYIIQCVTSWKIP